MKRGRECTIRIVKLMDGYAELHITPAHKVTQIQPIPHAEIGEKCIERHIAPGTIHSYRSTYGQFSEKHLNKTMRWSVPKGIS